MLSYHYKIHNSSSPLISLLKNLWQTQSLIKMLIASSQNISAGVNAYKKGQRYLGDSHTLVRVLCHKKDREASKFLKRHYRFPASSGNHLFHCLNDPCSYLTQPLVQSITI